MNLTRLHRRPIDPDVLYEQYEDAMLAPYKPADTDFYFGWKSNAWRQISGLVADVLAEFVDQTAMTAAQVDDLKRALTIGLHGAPGSGHHGVDREALLLTAAALGLMPSFAAWCERDER